MEELIFLFIFTLLFLYSFVYRNISILGMICSALLALYYDVNPIFVWAVVFIFSVVRFNKEGIKEEL